VHACAAWLALRDGELERASELGEAALDEWAADPGRGGPAVFQWSARFPLLAVELARRNPDAALEQARSLLDTRQQELPADLCELLRTAVDTGDHGVLERALDVARLTGYA
jgi:hypothetical protein